MKKLSIFKAFWWNLNFKNNKKMSQKFDFNFLQSQKRHYRDVTSTRPSRQPQSTKQKKKKLFPSWRRFNWVENRRKDVNWLHLLCFGLHSDETLESLLRLKMGFPLEGSGTRWKKGKIAWTKEYFSTVRAWRMKLIKAFKAWKYNWNSQWSERWQEISLSGSFFLRGGTLNMLRRTENCRLVC